MSKQANNEILEKSKDILRRHRNEIQKYSAIGTAVGYKTVKGRLSKQVALLFYVKKKKDPTELISEGIQPVPQEIEGIPTDVIEIPGGFELRTKK